MLKALRWVFTLVFLLVGVFAFSSEISGGIMYSFTNKLFYSAEFNTLALVKNAPNTTSGFTVLLATDLEKYYLSLGGIAKYDVKLDFGVIALYGMGGMFVPINDFGFEKITSIVRIGAKYYFGSFSLNSGLFSFYLIDNTKVEGIEFSFGYTF